MTTEQYDRTIKKHEYLKAIRMSVSDYIAQLPLFDAELNAEQLELLRRLDSKAPRRTSTTEQGSLFF